MRFSERENFLGLDGKSKRFSCVIFHLYLKKIIIEKLSSGDQAVYKCKLTTGSCGKTSSLASLIRQKFLYRNIFRLRSQMKNFPGEDISRDICECIALQQQQSELRNRSIMKKVP